MILDTNAVSALFEGDTALGERLARDARHHLPVIVIGEYRYGLLRSRHRRNLSLLMDSLVRESIILRVDETTAQTYAEVRDELRALGRPIPENDVWIAALARQHDEPVVSRDKHFEAVRDLQVLSWQRQELVFHWSSHDRFFPFWDFDARRDAKSLVARLEKNGYRPKVIVRSSDAATFIDAPAS